ncbi:MAG: choice-of-anchor L domain-containing protein, partial [Crocinitomicaceae bacterium]|nr:choice-of-anchor L domain-containing protein [Crocinitomicaceae bacterium]
MAKLEIEFIPLIDSLKIKYVFASDEYPYGSANFNDFFAVQLLKNDSVLDINIAALPSGHLTCINFVNNGFGNNGPCVHCEFYQENGDGSVSPYNTDNQFVQFDGFTRDTYVFADNLEVGTVYEMVMYLADAGDASIDSGVFIESCETCSFNVGVKEEILEGINFYPNPTSDKLFIDGGAGALYSIIDMQGNIFQKGTLLQNSQEISLDKLQTGIYFLQLTNGTSTKTEKLVVE